MINIFSLKTLLYMGMHGLGALLMFMSMLGTPGNLDENKPAVKSISKVVNLLMLTSWYGIPVLAIGSFVLILFGLGFWAKALGWISIGLGAGLLVLMIILYKNM